jgi:hypothetical protein
MNELLLVYSITVSMMVKAQSFFWRKSRKRLTVFPQVAILNYRAKQRLRKHAGMKRKGDRYGYSLQRFKK